MLLNLVNDLRHAARRLSTSRGFTIAAVLTIAIGVGINTGIFSILNSIALRNLPVPAAGELVGMGQTVEGIERRVYGATIMFSTAEYRTYRASAKTLSGLIGYSTEFRVTLGGESPQNIGGALVTCNYFTVLRRPLALGPGFRDEDCERSTAAPVVVIGHDLWRTVFAADPAIVGREVSLNRQRFKVVGVADGGMRGVDLVAASYFAPISTQPLLDPNLNLFGNENASWLTLLARRAPGTTFEQTRAELRAIAARIDRDQLVRKTTLLTETGRPVARPGMRPIFLAASTVVMVAFGLVMLIACANVANLSLARATVKTGEIAVRQSLGASRGRIVQQLLAESALIAVLGGALGSVLALWSFQGLVAFVLTALPHDAPQINLNNGPDGYVLVYALALTVAAGVLFGLVPALRVSKYDLNTVAKAVRMGQPAHTRLQGTLVGVQVAVCVVLMIATSLMLRGLYAAYTAQPGFRYENIAVASVSLGNMDAERTSTFEREVMARVKALPGIDTVARAMLLPLSDGKMPGLAGLPGQAILSPIDRNNVSADYFSLLEIPIVRGRAFTTNDETDTSTAAIVTETTARRLWPQRDPIGQALVIELEPNHRLEVQVVGIARDAQVTAIGVIPSSYVYLPAPRSQQGLQLLAKSRGDYANASAAIRNEVASLSPEAVVSIAPLEANLDTWRGLARVVSTLAIGLGAIALILAVIGVYGVVTYVVGRRTREIGVRLALGAQSKNIVALMLMRTMRPVLVGAAVGLLLGIGLSRVLSSVLFGVNPADPAALLFALVVVVGCAVVAGVVPARRASRADPNVVLHYE